jgi:hypothetical protein
VSFGKAQRPTRAGHFESRSQTPETPIWECIQLFPTMSEDRAGAAVERFILEEIESVPHLEALLLLWKSRPKQWTLEEMAHALYISLEATQGILQDLKQRGFICADSYHYFFDQGFHGAGLISELDLVYRRDLIRISQMIHSKASPAIREFARAFKLKKD